tara:strand:- start:2129 stop:2752 length:624 start_codon:yes stop_codon:yes gene_type:complete
MNDIEREKWMALRLGKITASAISNVIAKPTTAAYKNYLYTLATERFTHQRLSEDYQSPDMIRGIEMEDKAAFAYMLIENKEIYPADFVYHPTIGGSGASPDRYSGEEGLVEIKCPRAHNHLATLLGNEKIKREYQLQMQWQLACTERKWCDFVSYHPAFDNPYRLYVERIERDQNKINELETAVIDFNKEIEIVVNQLIQYRKNHER